MDEGSVVLRQVKKDGDRIEQARFQFFGCSAAFASAILVAEWLEGAAIGEAQSLTPERVVQTLDLAPEREPVAQMAIEAAKRAVADSRKS